mgnify:CR=1 FL=1
MKFKTAIFASLSGSIAEQMYLKAKQQSTMELPLLITNNTRAPFIERMKKYDEKVHIFNKSKDQEQLIIKFLQAHKIELIFLAGYMQILSPKFIDSYQRKIVNIHPSLLPKFKGAHGYRDSFNSKDNFGGITIHYVDEGIDTGPIISQVCFSKEITDSLEIFTRRGKEIEKIFYPQVFEHLVLNRRSLNEKI